MKRVYTVILILMLSSWGRALGKNVKSSQRLNNVIIESVTIHAQGVSVVGTELRFCSNGKYQKFHYYSGGSYWHDFEFGTYKYDSVSGMTTLRPTYSTSSFPRTFYKKNSRLEFRPKKNDKVMVKPRREDQPQEDPTNKGCLLEVSTEDHHSENELMLCLDSEHPGIYIVKRICLQQQNEETTTLHSVACRSILDIINSAKSIERNHPKLEADYQFTISINKPDKDLEIKVWKSGLIMIGQDKFIIRDSQKIQALLDILSTII